jgi:predicted phage tail protein
MLAERAHQMQGTDQKSLKAAANDAQGRIPATLTKPGAARFWLAVVLTGIGAGASAAALSLVLSEAQHLAWPSANGELLDAATAAGPWRHIFVLLGAGLLTGLAQILARTNETASKYA